MSMLPPSDLTAPSQPPPWTLPATIVLRAMIPVSGVGGTVGTASDSMTPMPPPNGAALRQIVTLDRRRPPSASLYTPPPRTRAVLPEIVVFSMIPPASPIEYSPPPRPVSSRGPKRARLLAISEPRMTSVESEALANPPPFSAEFCVIVVSITVNSLLDVLWMPPPLPVAVLPVTRTRVNVTRSPLFSTPPPPASSPRAWLLRISLSVMRTVPDPWMASAPPSPWVSLRSKIVRSTVNGPEPPMWRPPPVPSPSTGRPTSSTELMPPAFSRNKVSPTTPARSPSKMTAPPLPEDWLPTKLLSVMSMLERPPAEIAPPSSGARFWVKSVFVMISSASPSLMIAPPDAATLFSSNSLSLISSLGRVPAAVVSPSK